MKKSVILVLCLIVALSTKAQFTDVGVRVGFGVAKIHDDMPMLPTLGYNIGGYVNYHFLKSKKDWQKNFYLQTGISILGKGSNYKQETPESVTKGYFRNGYLQVPIIVGYTINIKKEHKINITIGPAISLGVYGKHRERKISPMYLESHGSYENYDISGRTFKDSIGNIDKFRRLDFGAVVGIGYQYKNFTFDFLFDYSFLILTHKTDVLRQNYYNPSQSNNTETETTAIGSNTSEVDDNDINKWKNRTSFSGNNETFIFSLGYMFPLRTKHKR